MDAKSWNRRRNYRGIRKDMTVMTAGTGGFSGSAAATGPVAGFDPVLDFRKRAARKIKDTPYAQEYKSKRKKSKRNTSVTTFEEAQPVQETALFQYKVKIPEIGETIIFASSLGELQMKLRLLINPKYRGEIDIERYTPSASGKFYMDKRGKALRNVSEMTNVQQPDEKVAPKANPKKAQQNANGEELKANMSAAMDMQKKKQAAAQAQMKIAIEKKKIELKKQEMQKALQQKTQMLKKQATMGSLQNTTEEFIEEGTNIDIIKKTSSSDAPGMLKFLNGSSVQIEPSIAKKVWSAYESLVAQKNKSKFSNACCESPESFQRVVKFATGEK